MFLPDSRLTQRTSAYHTNTSLVLLLQTAMFIAMAAGAVYALAALPAKARSPVHLMHGTFM